MAIKKKIIFHIILYTIIIGVAAYLIHFLFYTKTGLKLTHTNINDLSVYLKSFGTFAIILGILAILVQVFFPFAPFVLIAGANVLVFGLWRGFIINYLTSVAGAVLAFLFARYLGHAWVEKKIAKYPLITQFNNQLQNNGFMYVLIGRMIPIIPSSGINFGGGVSKIRFRQFFMGTVIGKFPIVFMESLIAHDLQHLHHYRGRLISIMLLFLGLILLGNWVRKKSFGRTKIE